MCATAKTPRPQGRSVLRICNVEREPNMFVLDEADTIEELR